MHPLCIVVKLCTETTWKQVYHMVSKTHWGRSVVVLWLNVWGVCEYLCLWICPGSNQIQLSAPFFCICNSSGVKESNILKCSHFSWPALLAWTHQVKVDYSVVLLFFCLFFCTSWNIDQWPLPPCFRARSAACQSLYPRPTSVCTLPNRALMYY